MKEVEEADENVIDKATRDKLAESISDKTLKASAADLKEMEKSFEDVFLRETLKQYKAELPKGYTRTAVMGGKVFFKILTKKAGFEPEINAECLARNIPTEDKDLIAEYGEDVDLEMVPIKTKKAALKRHEAWGEHRKNTKISFDDHFKLTKAIVPVSAEMTEVLNKQKEVLLSL